MMNFSLSHLDAQEVLDSRGRPTLEVSASLDNGAVGHAGVPSGASTGGHEAVELRDGDPARFEGRGVLTARRHVREEIAHAVVGREYSGLEELDRALIDLDGTDGKGRLGANAIVGVSLAVARALAQAGGRPLWQMIADLASTAPRSPVPHFNVVNGGIHASNELEFQEFMIAPLGAPSVREAVRAGAEIYSALRGALSGRGLTTGLGDEGGYAPELDRPEQVLSVLVESIDIAGYKIGPTGVAIAMDPAANGFFEDGSYLLAGVRLTTDDMIERYDEMARSFPIWSLEDGLSESDWAGWQKLTERLGSRLQIVGDDIFTTNAATIRRGIEEGVATAALIKVNQVGTVTETLSAVAACRQGGWAQMVSHRSGETTDSFIADLAIGIGCGQLKSGAPARGERVAKYNRLMQASLEGDLPYGLA